MKLPLLAAVCALAVAPLSACGSLTEDNDAKSSGNEIERRNDARGLLPKTWTEAGRMASRNCCIVKPWTQPTAIHNEGLIREPRERNTATCPFCERIRAGNRHHHRLI